MQEKEKKKKTKTWIEGNELVDKFKITHTSKGRVYEKTMYTCKRCDDDKMNETTK